MVVNGASLTWHVESGGMSGTIAPSPSSNFGY
jgi:hypothetical protein